MTRSDRIFEFKTRLIGGVVLIILGKFPFWGDMSRPNYFLYTLGGIFLMTALIIGLVLINDHLDKKNS